MVGIDDCLQARCARVLETRRPGLVLFFIPKLFEYKYDLQYIY